MINLSSNQLYHLCRGQYICAFNAVLVVSIGTPHLSRAGDTDDLVVVLVVGFCPVNLVRPTVAVEIF